MTQFKYTAINADGARVTDVLDAANRGEVLGWLQQQGHLAIEVLELGEGATPRLDTASKATRGRSKRRISQSEITLFTSETSMLLNSGLTLLQALQMLELQLPSSRSKLLINDIRSAIADGKSFEEALIATGAFPTLYTTMVRVAEATGTTRQVLSRLAEDRRRDAKLRSNLLSAMLYPAFLIVTAVAAVLLVLVVVVPRFKDVIGDNRGTLPPSAQLVFGASDWLLAHGIWLAVGCLTSGIIASLLYRIGSPRAVFEELALRLPLIGNLMRMSLTVRFTRTLSTLLGNGVGLPEALELTRTAIGNIGMARVIAEMGTELRKGQDFLVPLQQSHLLTPMVVNMLRIGIGTGSLGVAAGHLAGMYQDKLETSIARLFTILEPVLILFVSALVAGIVVSIMGAVFSVNDLVLG